MDVAYTYRDIVTKPWFQWLCIIIGFALIYWGVVAVAKEDEEAREKESDITDNARKAFSDELHAVFDESRAGVDALLSKVEASSRLTRLMASAFLLQEQ